MNSGPNSQRRTILVIDDEHGVLEMVKAALESEGYAVHAASNADEGIKLYEEHWRNIELVLLDFLMPGMTGDHVLECLQSLDPDVRVVLLTANKYSFQRHLHASSILGCLEKPFELAELSERVREALTPA
jgi:CheY-like chemotaxis protein